MSQNTTATGGILLPHPQPPTLTTVPANLTFVEFVQGMLTGLSGFPGPLVRPEWQQEPPKDPDIDVNWLAFGLGQAVPDFNAYTGFDVNNNPTLQRNELINIIVSVYGPAAYDNIALIRDGFQLTQNLTTMRLANVGFAYDTPAQHVPDFFNERWFERWRAEFFVRRQINRTYSILSFVSASGTINTETAVNDNFTLPFAAGG
jgi:hypothetical protein